MNDKTRVENIDCMIRMREFPDKYFDLAIVDPPYGIGMDGKGVGFSGKMKQNGRTQLNIPGKVWPKKEWDSSIPDANYFSELFRVSKNQIIWGGQLLYPAP